MKEDIKKMIESLDERQTRLVYMFVLKMAKKAG